MSQASPSDTADVEQPTSSGGHDTATAVDATPRATVAPSRPLADRVGRHLDAATEHLLGLQHQPGYWCAELEGDSILQSEYILLKWILGQEDDPRLPKIAAYLRRQQWPDGSWR